MKSKQSPLKLGHLERGWVECIYGMESDVKLFLDKQNVVYLSRQQARDLAKRLTEAANEADNMERNEKYKTIGEKPNEDE